MIVETIFATVFDRVLKAVMKPDVPVTDAQAEAVAKAVTQAVAPVVVNASNSEPLWQSRVAIGSLAPILAALSDLISMYATDSWDQQRVITDLVVLSGAAFALYGRIFGAKLNPLGN